MKPLRYILASILILLLACTTGKQQNAIETQESLVSGQVDKAPVYHEPSPDQFLQSKFPTSDIMLNAVISYLKTVISTHKASDVKAVNQLNGKTIYMTDNQIQTNLTDCSAILTDSAYTDIQTADTYILAHNDEKMELYDTTLCGGILKGRMKLKNIRLIPPYIVFFEEKAFSISKIGMRDEVLSGTLKTNIMDIGGTNQFLSIINDVGQFITLDIAAKEFIYSEDIGINFIDWKIHKYTLFGITDDQFFTTIQTVWNGETFLLEKAVIADLSHYHRCTLAGRGVALTCDNTLLAPDQQINVGKEFQKFIVSDTAYYGIYNNDLFELLIDKKRYQKKVDLKGYEFHGCMQENKLLLDDIDKTIKSIDLETQTVDVIDQIQGCTTSLELLDGHLIDPEGNRIYTFAENMRTEQNSTLYKRTIAENIYYFFVQNEELITSH